MWHYSSRETARTRDGIMKAKGGRAPRGEEGGGGWFGHLTSQGALSNPGAQLLLNWRTTRQHHVQARSLCRLVRIKLKSQRA